MQDFAILGLCDFFLKKVAISFKNNNFCYLGGGRSKKISQCRGSSPEVGWEDFGLVWGVNMESWNAFSTPAAKGGKMKFSL